MHDAEPGAARVGGACVDAHEMIRLAVRGPRLLTFVVCRFDPLTATSSDCGVIGLPRAPELSMHGESKCNPANRLGIRDNLRADSLHVHACDALTARATDCTRQTAKATLV